VPFTAVRKKIELRLAVGSFTMLRMSCGLRHARALDLEGLCNDVEALDPEHRDVELVIDAVRQRGGGGEPLPPDVRRKMESVFGADFSAVRVSEGRAASALGVRAFACGYDLFFAPGQYEPHTAGGQRLLGHELAHVLQQQEGRVSNPFGRGVAVVQDDELEAEADRMGLLAAAHRGAHVSRVCAAASSGASGPVVQCAFTGVLTGKNLAYFQANVPGITFKEFNDLSKPGTNYATLEEVKKGLATLRTARPVVPAPVVPGLGPTGKIPDAWKVTFGPLLLYRAVDLTPGKMKHKGRFSPRTNPLLALPKAIAGIVADPRGFAEGHVRNNYDYVHSASPNEKCQGYADTREYVYRINVPAMHKFTPFPEARSAVLREPVIWADTSDRALKNATKIAFDPRKEGSGEGGEVDLIFDVELTMIDAFKKKGTTTWVPINWSQIQAEI